MLTGEGFSFGGDENVLKLIVMMFAQLCEHTKMGKCELYLSKKQKIGRGCTQSNLEEFRHMMNKASNSVERGGGLIHVICLKASWGSPETRSPRLSQEVSLAVLFCNCCVTSSWRMFTFYSHLPSAQTCTRGSFHVTCLLPGLRDSHRYYKASCPFFLVRILT